MADTYLAYFGVTGPENVLLGVDRGDGVLGTLVGEPPSGDVGKVNTYLEYFGVTSSQNVRSGTNRGDGVIGSLEVFDALPAGASIESIVLYVVENSDSTIALMGIDKYVTGQKKLPSLPYCTLNQEGGAPAIRSNTSRIDRHLMRFQLWHGEHAAGKAIQNALINLFDNLSLDLAIAGLPKSVLYARVQNNFAIEEPDSVWQFLIDIDFWSE